jgi:diadenosine tetraphosphate (Ap4A) HIT family hydrolase
MSSFIIQSHVGRQVPLAWSHNDTCPFCRILPLRAGHTLVIPKAHIPRLSDLPPDLASAVGEAVSKVANALTEGALLLFILEIRLSSNDSFKAMGNTGLNVVCNQEYAQAVPHVSAVHCCSKLNLFEYFLS